MNEKLHTDFLKAVDSVNDYPHPLPADVLLKLYAFYKIAKQYAQQPPQSKTPLINAFKANALIQAQNVSQEEAMKSYVALVRKEILAKAG
jgi:acyl-CoA-binding protein